MQIVDRTRPALQDVFVQVVDRTRHTIQAVLCKLQAELGLLFRLCCASCRQNLAYYTGCVVQVVGRTRPTLQAVLCKF